MKTKFVLLTAILLIVMALAVGCNGLISQVSSISIKTFPRTEYTVGENIDNEMIEIYVEFTNGANQSISFTKANASSVGVTIENFHTDTEGTRTATVTYSSVSCRFDYVVKSASSSGFAGGSGTETDPYQIANAEQFKNIVLKGNSDVYTYYKLISDIDLSGLYVKGDEYYNKIDVGHFKYPRVSDYSFKGSLDGARPAGGNFALMNFTAIDDLGIIGSISQGDFSNIDIRNFNTLGYRVGAFGTGTFSDILSDNPANDTYATFTNVHVLADCKMGFAGFIYQAKNTKSVTFNSCTMAGTVFGDGNNVGGFMGDSQTLTRETVFNNCAMTGSVLGYEFVGEYVGWHSIELVYNNTPHTQENVSHFSTGTSALNEGTKLGVFNVNPDDITDGTLTDPGISGAAYYRVVYTTVLDHFVKIDETNYKLHFAGGYNTPVYVSEKLSGNEWEFPAYTRAYFEVPSNINFFDKDGVTPITRSDCWVETAPDIIGGLFVADNFSGNSLVIGKYSANPGQLTVFVFAYNAEGEVIAASQKIVLTY